MASNQQMRVRELIKEPLQKLSSDLCGLYCIYIAHYIFSGYYPTIPFINEKELFRFIHHFIV